MPFDTLTMAAVADEVQATATGGRIQKIIQPSASSVAVAIYSGGARRWLLLSADAQYARVHFSGDRLAKAFPTPSSFVMLLRKYLDGARISKITQVPRERVLRITCSAAGSEVELVAEVMGKHSNVILANDDGHILGALKVISPHQSRVRPILPGSRYEPPPSQSRDSAIFPPGDRVDPLLDGDLICGLLSEAPPDTPMRAALLGALSGVSPFLVDQIAARAGYSADAPVGGLDLQRVLVATVGLYGLPTTGDWRPCTFTNHRGRADFAPYVPLTMENVTEAPTISAAIEQCLGEHESRDVLANSRSLLLADVERARTSVERRLASLRDGLERAENAESMMQGGQLLLAYQYAATPGADELAIPDLDLRIPLDPALSAVENAERMFRRYRKLRDAQRKIPALLSESEAELTRLQDLAVFAQLAGSEAELRALRAEMNGRERRPSDKRKETRDKPRGPARFRREGYVALVGRNARENEEATFRVARRDDLWLHSRQRTGAHVILTRDGKAPSDDAIEAAARLAAYYSEGRTDTRVDVDITEVRNVRKIPGGAPGRVTYQHFRTLRVEPGIDSWTAEKGG